MPANPKQQVRIKSEFYRILLTSDKTAQTIALVPDALIAHELTQLLSRHVKIRADQRFHCKPCQLRPEAQSDEEFSLNWDTREDAWSFAR
jgi:hypothetical protein